MITTEQRDDTIVALAAQGWTLIRIGKEVGLTRERVRQILAANGKRTATHDDHLARAAQDWRDSGQVRNVGDVLAEHGLAPNARNTAILRRAVPELALPPTRDVAPSWDESVIVAAVRDTARRNGIDIATGWLRFKDYARLRLPTDPAPATIGANFLWSSIMRAAGFDPANAPRRGRKQGYRPRKITQEQIDRAVLDYMHGADRLTAAGLDTFLRADPHRPSMATVRNRFRAEGITTLAGMFTAVQERNG